MNVDTESPWSLRAVQGPGKGVLLPLRYGDTFLGRIVQPGELRIRDDSISRRHAVVTVSDTGVSIVDTGSTNGTSVNGQMIDRPTPLAEGDRVILGETEFMLISEIGATTTLRREPDGAMTTVVPQPPPTHVQSAVTPPPAPRDPEPEEPSLRTIMFTDLVGSTAMAQALGDTRAIAVLGVHDRVVRGAITANRGREVKHTGDGIMASFSSAAAGVQAAIEIMRGIREEVQQDPTLSLRIRVGLNAGEPLSSHGDLYGLAVSLAARLCDAAEPSMILASDAVRMLCLGKELSFVDQGTRTLKGIQHPVTVCEVIWDESPDQEPPPPPE